MTIIEHIQTLVEYNWKDEKKHFCEEYEIEMSPGNDSLDDWIKFIEEKGWTNHIYYSLLILKKEFTQ